MSENIHPLFKSALEAIAPRSRPLLFADASVIRAAIFDIADAGWLCSTGCDIKHPWNFNQSDESDDQTHHRERFVEEVMRRVRVLQGPMFNLGVKIENYCNRHMHERLPAPTAFLCADCESEFKARLG